MKELKDLVIPPITKEACEYLINVRKLNDEAITAYRLGSNKHGEIALPFYNEFNELNLVKFRHPKGEILKKQRLTENQTHEDYECKSYCMPGGRAVLFGSHLCDPKLGPLVICFGDYDAMACFVDGIPNCVSPPFGDQSLKWIDNQFDWLQEFSQYIIYPDLDTNKKIKKMMEEKYDELAKRLGKYKCRLVPESFRYKTKDANKLLIDYGLGFNRDAIEHSIEFPEKGLIKLADYKGTPVIAGHAMGFKQLDKRTGGLSGGQYSLLSGDNHAGKTTTALNIVAQYVKKRIPCLYWSGEQRAEILRCILEAIIAGPKYLKMVVDKETEAEYWFAKDEVVDLIREWYRDYVIIYDSRGVTLEKLFEVLELAIRRFGIELTILDNMLAFTTDDEDYYGSQATLSKNAKMFSEDWNHHMMVVSHNRKIDPRTLIPTKEDVEGSKKVTNWADFVFQSVRLYPPQQKDDYVGCDGIISLCKNRPFGELVDVRTVFDPKSRRIAPFVDQGMLNREFGWEKMIKGYEPEFMGGYDF